MPSRSWSGVTATVRRSPSDTRLRLLERRARADVAGEPAPGPWSCRSSPAARPATRPRRPRRRRRRPADGGVRCAATSRRASCGWGQPDVRSGLQRTGAAFGGAARAYTDREWRGEYARSAESPHCWPGRAAAQWTLPGRVGESPFTEPRHYFIGPRHALRAGRKCLRFGTRVQVLATTAEVWRVLASHSTASRSRVFVAAFRLSASDAGQVAPGRC